MATGDIRTFNGVRYRSIGWSQDRYIVRGEGPRLRRAQKQGVRIVIAPGESSKGDKGWETFVEIKRQTK